ncbi:MAG: type II toxin-antitoxin system RelE/ParE family toxin [Cyclobacteriaceae bacterium]
MIVNFADKQTKKVWEGVKTKEWHQDIQRMALRKLLMIQAAEDVKDLMIPPGNRLHKLKGELKDFWAIRINDQWRIIFKWIDNNAHDVQIIDYH